MKLVYTNESGKKVLTEQGLDRIFGYSLLLPTFLVFAIVIMYPIFNAVIMSFSDYTYFTVAKGDGFNWNGFKNYTGSRQHSGEMNANVNIDLYTALLGGEIIIQLKDGAKVKLKVKPETQNGTKVRLRGKGYDRGDGTYGDLIITYNVKLPTNLTERQKELFRQLQQNG